MEKFGRYELLEKIATGGMAEIWLARQAGLEGFEKLIVIKRILPHLAESEEFIQMFLHEARVAVRLNHPNVVQIFDLGSQDRSYFIAMEYIHGEDARKVWRHSVEVGKALPVPLVCRIIADAAAGLDYAHKRTDQAGQPLNIIHRDISPQNILVSFEGAVKVVDFGIAKAADQASHTRTGVLKGKYSYMSPEQAAGKDIDQRTDQFALATVLWELLTLQRLFKRDNEIRTLQAVAACEVPTPSQVAPRVPKDLDAIVLKALAKDAERRYRDLRELQVALEEWLLANRQPASATHLSEFMKGIYSERLARERASGRPLSADVAAAPAPEPKPAATRLAPRATPPSGQRLRPGPPIADPDAEPLAGARDRTPIDSPSERTSTTLSKRMRRAVARRKLAVGLAAAAGLAAGIALLFLLPHGHTGAAISSAQPKSPGQQTASLKVTTRPEGAQLTIDGRPHSERAPATVRGLAPGEHEVLAQLPGRLDARQRIELAAGKAASVELELDEATQEERVSVSVVTLPKGAEIFVGGVKVGAAPTTLKLSPNAKVEVVAELDGYLPSRRSFTVGTAPGQELVLELDRRASDLGARPQRPDSRPRETSHREPTRPIPTRPEASRPEPSRPEPARADPSGQGTLTVACDPPAEVYEGAVNLGRTPLEARFSQGNHTLTLVNFELGLSRPFGVAIRPGVTVEKSFKFNRGEVQFIITPGADVYLFKHKVAQIPGPKFAVVEGEQIFELVNEELKKTRQVTVLVKPGQVTRVPVNLLDD